MNFWKTVHTVFMKEIVDVLRDRRTLMVVLLSAVAIGPLLMVALSSLVNQLERRAEARELVVVGLDAAPTLRNFLQRQTYVVTTAPADWEARLKSGKLGDPVAVVPRDFEAALAHGEAPIVELVYSSANGRAQVGVNRITRLLQGFIQENLTLRLIARGVSPASLNVLQVDEHDVADSAARAAQLTGMLPYFVLMAVVYGAMNAALDTTAGERERGSLQPLLATPASRLALVIGKWGAVFCVAMLVAALSCLSFVPTQSLLRSDSLAALFRFGWREGVWFIGLLAPLAAALSALMMAIAIRCKSYKEAQANNTVLILAVSLIPLFGLFNQEGESPWHLWVPALAQNTLMARVLKGAAIGWSDIAPGLSTCGVLSLVSLHWVGRQLSRRAVS